MEESVAVATAAPQAPQTTSSAPQEKTRVDGEEGQKSPNDSEYDSAGSYSDEEQTKARSRNSGSESEGSVGLERESGDGQESAPLRKVDDDEDKKNPQYIPKRGTFYEHDDRTADDDQISTTIEIEKDKDQKKKVWQDKKEKWSHDRFNDTEQAPKSRAELVAIYGYDIRNEEGPPRARRRRRYGRGPNKYTRNWEDEDAYTKPPPPRVKKPLKKPTRGEDFPPLNTSPNQNENNREKQKERDDNRDYDDAPEQSQPETNGNVHKAPPLISEPPPPPAPPQEFQRMQQRVGSGRVVKPKREIKDSDYKGFTTKTRQVRNMKTDQKVVAKNQKREDFIQTQNFTNKNNNVQDLEKDMSKLNVQDGVYKGGKHGGQRQGSVPPRLQSEQKGSKRYSSIRQRSLPETATPPFTQHSNYYPNEFNQPNQVTLHQNPQIHPSTTQVPQIAPPPLPPIAQVPVTAAPILQAPQFAPPFAQAPPFLQPAPPPFIAQQTPQIINYVPSQAQFPQGYQGYQQQFTPVAVTQPELYQPQTGITYYSTDQQLSQRAVPLKRPKAAIPIVAPPPIDFKGKVKEDDVSSYEGDVSEGQTGDSSSAQESNIQVQQ